MDIREKCCCFTGHRIIMYEHLDVMSGKLDAVIAELYEKGIRDFITGGALGFDTLAAQAVLRARKNAEDLRLVLALPCREQAKNWHKKDVKVYNEIIEAADEVIYESEEYTAGCLLRRNRFMVDNSSYCVFYLTRTRGGTAYTVRYALENKIEMCNVITV